MPPDKRDNLNVLLTMYNRVERYDVFSVQVSKPGMELSRSYVLEQVEHLLMNSPKKEGALQCTDESHAATCISIKQSMYISDFNSCHLLLRQWQEEHWGLVFPRWLHHLQRYR